MKFLKFIAVFFATQSFSQTIGTTYLKFSGGYEKNGFTASASIDTHTSVNSFLRFGLEAQIEKYKFQGMDIPVKLGLFNTSYYQRIFSLDMEQTYNFYLGGGLVAGYEYLNDGDKFLPNNSEILIKSQFIYGLNAGAQMDIYLWEVGRHFDSGCFLIIEGNYNYFMNSDVGTIQPNIKVGFKISI